MTTKAVEVASEMQIVSTSPIDNDLIQRWLRFANVSSKSATTYLTCLKQLKVYFVANNINQPIRGDLENWRDSLISAGKAATTVQLYIHAAKLFYKWLAMEGLYTDIADNLKVRYRKSSNHKRDALSESQSKKLLEAAEGKSLKSLRDKAIIALMLTTGLRTIEVCRANIADIRYNGGKAYLYVQGKGRADKSECVEISAKVMRLINLYRQVRGAVKANAPLFAATSRRNFGGRLDTQTIRKMVKGNLRKIDLDSPRLTAHSLRHTAATIMLTHKQSLQSVKLVLRHSNINTTLIYLHNLDRLNCTAENVVADCLLA